MENSMEVSRNIKNRPTYDPATLLLGMFPEEKKTGFQRGI